MQFAVQQWKNPSSGSGVASTQEEVDAGLTELARLAELAAARARQLARTALGVPSAATGTVGNAADQIRDAIANGVPVPQFTQPVNPGQQAAGGNPNAGKVTPQILAMWGRDP